VIQLFNERLSAEEAVEVGLVTEIIGEKLDIYAE
jgi:ATP-dependent protease ClpP protease subunit